jgi:glycyl-tRNA synthetase
MILLPPSGRGKMTPNLYIYISRKIKKLMTARYSRNDELGTPLGITVDFQSLKDGTVTLRDRDTTRQVRAGQDEIVEAIMRIVQGTETWSQISARLPKFESQELE